ncbi:MAG: ribonuclease Y [Dehalococcoidales bacterium]|nr:ribonuclease Y [Dehalococcoidales bacterium]MDP7525150.1 ribonuclease Y [Dehalococcoidales bacterium]
MDTIVVILAIVMAGVIGLIAGGLIVYFFRRMTLLRQLRNAQRRAARMVSEAREESATLLRETKDEVEKNRTKTETDLRERRSELQRQENRLSSKTETVERRSGNLEQRERNLANREKGLETLRTDITQIKDDQLKQLELVSGMSTDEAKQDLFARMEGEMKEETTRRLRDWEEELKDEADVRAQGILSVAIQRSASEIVSEISVVSVPLPGDEMKGRLIGREGRNIRALEQATGVDLIIDDTPEAVTLSSFDPVRREVARLALTKLIADGRIHPARIEEVVTKTKEEVEATMFAAGEQAAFQVEVAGLRPELIRILGRLKYRTSYGQNVLAHSIETAFLAGIIASELGADVAIARKAGLLHDIGKAIDREVEGTHTAIGADLVKQWDKSPEVLQGVAEHHLDSSSTSVWGYIISAADAISSARPGARRESVENYLKRLNALEEIANGFKGVDKSFAIQAGREVRILVKPEEIDDLGAMRMARDIVRKIEEGLSYPGQIKVTVLRETRATDYAK